MARKGTPTRVNSPRRIKKGEPGNGKKKFVVRAKKRDTEKTIRYGDENMKIKKLPWGVMRMASPFVRMLRELLEMRYLWLETVELDNAKLIAFLGDEPHTLLDTALPQSLEGLGCIKSRAPQVTAREVPV